MSLPPLTSIRAFEVAARLQSFTRASAELNVTQSAISSQIRNLELALGVRLFVRGHRSVTLTPEGERYLADLSDVFRRLSWATSRLRAASGREVLRIHTFATFAMSFLIPRIGRFQEAYPDIEIQLSASSRQWNFQREQVHIQIGLSLEPSEQNDRLFEAAHIPVCTPQYSRKHRLSESVSSLDNVTLLHSIAAGQQWREWAEGVGLPEFHVDRGFRFESQVMSVMASEQGLGVALAQPQFVLERIQRNTLVMPIPKLFSIGLGYVMSSSMMRSSLKGPISAFREWLLDEVAKCNAEVALGRIETFRRSAFL